MSTTKGSAGDCGCCEGVATVTPVSTANRPGLNALKYRVGTHGAFLASMTARLSMVRLNEHGQEQNPLAGLTTRASDDPTMALLDAWATTADVLSFYQERIANEGYLRTATERKSLVELGRLVGYAPRPGVAASAFLAFTLDDEYKIEIPAGTRAQSVPAKPDELPQFFETSEAIEARSEWNEIRPRLTRPQALRSSKEKIENGIEPLYFKGTATNLKPGDRLLIDFGKTQSFVQVATVEEQPADDPTKGTDRTKVTLVPPPTAVGLQVSAPGVGQPLPSILHASSLRELMTSISDVGELAEGELPARLAKLVAALLTTLRAVAKMSPSIAKAKAQAEMLSALTATKGTLAKVKARAGRSAFAGHLSAVTELLGSVERIIQSETNGAGNAAPATVLGGLYHQLLEPTPASAIPPAHASRLPRDLETTFAENSDAGTKLLTQLQPALQSLLYEVWGKAAVTDPSPVKVYALRTQAAVFGHNAPLKPILDDEGRIIGYDEWTLKRHLGVTEEDFELKLTFVAGGHNETTNVKVTINGKEGLTTLNAEDGWEQTIPFEDSTEAVTLNMIWPEDRWKMEFSFDERAIKGTVSGTIQGGETSVITESTGETTVTITSTEVEVPAGLPSINNEFSMAIRGKLSTRVSGDPTERSDTIALDSEYSGVVPEGWIVVVRAGEKVPRVIAKTTDAYTGSRADYGISGKVTWVKWDPKGSTEDGAEKNEWINPKSGTFDIIRSTTVFAQSELLKLAEAPIIVDETGEAEPVCADRIELEGLYEGLEAGRWLIVSGERTDIEGVTGVKWSELVMLAGVEQVADETSRGGRTHSSLVLANTLAYKYKRDTVKIYGNVVNASHGESRIQVLGSGDARESGQTFPLAFKPLTFLAAPTANGADSTLAVRVNEVLWPESDSPVGLGPDDRGYYTRIDEEDNVSVVFGGARLPTGVENVTAEYRQGIGRGGNVVAEQISQLATQPLGVSKVINPLRASGGADPDGSEVVRRNAPLEVMALDRLVSVQDYADFARRFAGIAKADARRLSLGRRHVIHVTIAAVGDAPIDETSDLFLNLQDALRLQGDPYLPVEVAARELLLLIIVANVRVRPDFRWESVKPSVDSVLLDTFSFDRRHLGQDVVLGDVIRTIHNVDGVQYVDVDVLGYVPQDIRPSGLPKLVKRLRSQDQSRVASKPARAEGDKSKPAQLAYLSPELPDTLLLQEIRG